MSFSRRCIIVSLLILMTASMAWATKLEPLNLAQMCHRSGQIYSGTVVSVEEDSVDFGGGTWPVLVYTIRVEEGFKGSFETIKGQQVATLRTIGTLKQQQSGQAPIPGFPMLKEGQSYLLMVAPASPATGLTATVGLGQGCFELDGKVAVNLFDNVGLFRGMSAPQTSGAMTYDDLRNRIQNILGGGQ